MEMTQYKAKVDHEMDELTTRTCHETQTIMTNTDTRIEDMKKEFLAKNE